MMILGINITDIHIDIARTLINKLNTNGDELITYSELSNQIGGFPDQRNLDMYLGDLSWICKNYGMPLISSIVINKEEKMPGNGYFKEFFNNIKTKDERYIHWALYIKEVINFKGWEKLQCLLNID